MLGCLGAGSVGLCARGQGLQQFAGEVDPQGQRLQHRRVARPVVMTVREALGGVALGIGGRGPDLLDLAGAVRLDDDVGLGVLGASAHAPCLGERCGVRLGDRPGRVPGQVPVGPASLGQDDVDLVQGAVDDHEHVVVVPRVARAQHLDDASVRVVPGVPVHRCGIRPVPGQIRDRVAFQDLPGREA